MSKYNYMIVNGDWCVVDTENDHRVVSKHTNKYTAMRESFYLNNKNAEQSREVLS